MLYLIGGPAKVGKSKLAKQLLATAGISYFPLDAIIVALKENGHGAFTEDVFESEFKPYFQSFIKHLPYLMEDICLEGNAFSPKTLDALRNEKNIKFKVCFLGMLSTDIDTILRYAGPETWLITDLSEEKRMQYPEKLAKQSAELKLDCEKYGFRYFDLSNDYETNLSEALAYLSS